MCNCQGYRIRITIWAMRREKGKERTFNEIIQSQARDVENKSKLYINAYC